MWSSINGVLNAVFDTLLWPFQGLPALWQVLVLAIPTTMVALLAFRYTSNQDGIRAVKNRIKANLLELRLYKDDFRVTMAAQGRILRNSLTYMRYGLVPMAVMILPFVLILIQVESRYAFRCLHAGESTILSIIVESETPVSALPVELVLPPGLSRETPALRIDSTAEIFWRLRADGPGDYPVTIRLGNEGVNKRVVVAEEGQKISPFIFRSNDIQALAYPMEPHLDAETIVSEIGIEYPRNLVEFGGLSSASWALFGMCLVLGLLLRRFFKVTF